MFRNIIDGVDTISKEEIYKVLNGRTVQCIMETNGTDTLFGMRDVENGTVYILDQITNKGGAKECLKREL